jgi:hypothetical protein
VGVIEMRVGVQDVLDVGKPEAELDDIVFVSV